MIKISPIRVFPSWRCKVKEPTNNCLYRNRKTGSVRYGRFNYYWPSDTFWIKVQGVAAVSRMGADEPEFGAWELLGKMDFNGIPSEVDTVWVNLEQKI